MLRGAIAAGRVAVPNLDCGKIRCNFLLSMMMVMEPFCDINVGSATLFRFLDLWFSEACEKLVQTSYVLLPVQVSGFFFFFIFFFNFCHLCSGQDR